MRSSKKRVMNGKSWIEAGMAGWMLGIEAAQVITLRMIKLAAGGKAAKAEAKRMVAEKIKANSNLAVRALSGGLGSTPQDVAKKTANHYRRKVRANRKRLSGG